MRKPALFALIGLLFFGTAVKYKKLEDVEKDHYQALKVWMSEDQNKAFFKLKTEEERNQFLKDEGLWERFYKYEDFVRDKILHGELEVGWTQDMVWMASVSYTHLRAHET